MIFNKTCVHVSGDQSLINKLLSDQVIDFVVKREDGSYLFSWYDFSYRLTKINNCTNLLRKLKVTEYVYAGPHKGEDCDFFFTDVGVIGIINTVTDNKNYKLYYYKIKASWFTDSNKREKLEVYRLEKDVKSGRINWNESFKGSENLRTLSRVQKDVLIQRYWDFFEEREKEDIWIGSTLEKKFGTLEDLRQIYEDL